MINYQYLIWGLEDDDVESLDVDEDRPDCDHRNGRRTRIEIHHLNHQDRE